MNGLNGRRERPTVRLGDAPYHLGYEALSLNPWQLNGHADRLVIGLVEIRPGVGRLMIFRTLYHALGKCVEILGPLNQLPELSERPLHESLLLTRETLSQLRRLVR